MARMDFSRCRRSGTVYEAADKPKKPKWHSNAPAKAASAGHSLGPEERRALAQRMGLACS